MAGDEVRNEITALEPTLGTDTAIAEDNNPNEESTRNETKLSNEEENKPDGEHVLQSQEPDDVIEQTADKPDNEKEPENQTVEDDTEQTKLADDERAVENKEQNTGESPEDNGDVHLKATEGETHDYTDQETTASKAESGPDEITGQNNVTEADHRSDDLSTAHHSQLGYDDEEEWSEGEHEGTDFSGTDRGSGDSMKSGDVIATDDLVPKSILLEPIPEPDFTNLADKEKLFPRPKLSNPRVAYELSCKQLKVVPVSQYLSSIENYTEQLRLQQYGLTQLDMLPLCLSLSYNTIATDLNLSQNRLEHDVLPAITSMMRDNSYIGRIDLSYSNLAGPGLQSLQQLFAENYTLTELNLSHCRLLDAHAPTIAAVIEISLNLRHLHLRYNALCDCGKVLGKVLAADEGLETLDLSWNTFRGRSARDLLTALKNNTRLRRLDLSWNSLGPDTGAALRQLLRRNATLAELDLSHNRLVDENMRPVGLGLAKNATLEKLWLGYNPVSPVGALALVRFLPKTSASYVDLSQIEVSSDFVKLMGKLNPEVITVVHGTINKDMVLIAPPEKKGFRSGPAKKKK